MSHDFNMKAHVPCDQRGAATGTRLQTTVAGSR
jgi:hypothetical protein